MKNQTPSLLLGLFATLTLTHCTRTQERVFSGSQFGSSYEIRVADRRLPDATIESVLQNIFGETEQIFGSSDSELTRFNQSEKLQWLGASRTLVTVVEEALRMAKLSNGAIDPTSGKLNEIWKTKAPGPQTVTAAKSKVGHFYLEARQEPLGLKKSRRGIVVDLTYLLPGYIVDTISEKFRARGMTNYRVAMAGAIRAAGKNGRGEFWPYSYQRPAVAGVAPVNLTSDVISLENRAVATVAEPGGAIPTSPPPVVDPRSGKPLQTDLMNVTVLELSALKALGYAAAFFALGKQEGMSLARKQGVGAFFVAAQGEGAIAEATSLFPSPIRSTY